jgi:hypothetical protein
MQMREENFHHGFSMKYLPFKLWIAVIALSSGLIFGQTDSLPPLDESQFSDPAAGGNPAPVAPVSTPAPVPVSTPAFDSVTPQPAAPAHSTQVNSAEKAKPLPNLGPEPDLGPEPSLSTSISEVGNAVKTAIIDGVQVSSEPGEKPEEKVVTCYFIFQDKPSSYFYEVRLKEKKIVFEFNDTKKSDAPINFTAESPMKDFSVDQKQIDVNKEIKGLKPEYHSQVRVVFNLAAVPKIQVNDEFNVISFTYKWNSDPVKQKDYIDIDNGPTVVKWSVGGVAAVGVATAAYIFFKPKTTDPPERPLPTDDLPSVPAVH